MLRGLLPHSDTDIYLTCVNLNTEERKEKIRAHGEPTAERIDMEAVLTDMSWLTTVKRSALKSTFLNRLQNTARTASVTDRVLVIVSGHGELESGDIAIGEYGRLMSFHRDPALLRAEEVYAVLRECAGNCTVLVNAYASGQWTKTAAQLLPGSLDHRITLCTRGTEGEEIYSHHLSGSGEFCGGFYINGVAGRLYEEVGLHFPQPHIVNGK
ncbi:hypothetical protein EV426DRAFT_433611 [Tirmania nivea]|nr:hypothetical protein EV426DRAFT_433611 [Tirmania nivea]